MSDIVLDIRDLQVQFVADEKKTVAVDRINFTLERGKTLGIVGESGSGKSVTSLAIMGLLAPTAQVQGEIWFSPQPGQSPVDLLALSENAKRQFRGGQIAMIFQEPMSSLNPVYNIGFQLTEAIRLHQQVSPEEARRKAIASLQEVKLLAEDEQLYEQLQSENPGQNIRPRDVNARKQAMLKRYPHQLSGGQLQRVMIAMAISCNPTVLIADEPTTALDVTVQATILELLRELCAARSMSLIFITHDLGVIAEIADQVAVMYRGKIVETAATRSLFSHSQHPYTKGLLACRPQLDNNPDLLPTVSDYMEVITNANGEIVIREKPEIPKNLSLDVRPTEAETPLSGQTLLKVNKLRVGFPMQGIFGQTKRYFMAVNDISFEVYEGETLGLVGESGCGKSTLARTLLRLTPSMSGNIYFEEEDITNLQGKRLRQLRRQVQIVFQNPYNSLDPRFSVGQTILEPLNIHNAGASPKKRRDRVAYLLERVGLSPDAMKRYPHEFSGGQRQRICIARALALNPKFIICDESVSALDVSVQAQVLNLLKELQAEFGLTYIFISHDLSVVKFMSDRIMVMNKGRIEEIGPANDIYRSPQKDYTRQLIASIPTGGFESVRS
ncbi:MAG: ABC transporter ATP-binding protein [Jaaginema sp. PMC 1079.18]|nr:ABC transporter ATP-binding protein [Jaaginema sp. PMC 1080.18]MEC4849917.1 ABC transporter ATP-binding protein [Jaaginema sp. PMC 1079.18]MEC4868853.1 ABC transporter ATP-binding protein [Jaaginema sp. PMC 1078.18]